VSGLSHGRRAYRGRGSRPRGGRHRLRKHRVTKSSEHPLGRIMDSRRAPDTRTRCGQGMIPSWEDAAADPSASSGTRDLATAVNRLLRRSLRAVGRAYAQLYRRPTAVCRTGRIPAVGPTAAAKLLYLLPLAVTAGIRRSPPGPAGAATTNSAAPATSQEVRRRLTAISSSHCPTVSALPPSAHSPALAAAAVSAAGFVSTTTEDPGSKMTPDLPS
jgi:hypothetical protein